MYPPDFVERFWKKVDKSPGLGPKGQCWLWTGSLRRDGYGQIASPFIKHWPLRAHVVSWQLQHGEIPDGMCVLHECDNPPCVRELFLGSHMQNMDDCTRKGRRIFAPHYQGAEHPSAKLTWDVARLIRSLAKSGSSSYAISSALNIPRRTVRRILSNESYVVV